MSVKLAAPKTAAEPEPEDPRASEIPPEVSEASHEVLARHGVRYPPRRADNLPGDSLRRVAAYAGGARRAPPTSPPARALPKPKKAAAFQPWTLQELIDELEGELL